MGAFGLGPAPAPQTVALTTSAIDVSSYPYCKLSFYQYYRNFQSTTVIGISTDSINWTLDTINTNVTTNVATASNSKVEVDLSGVINAGGTPAPKVYISFIMDANYYFWMIDDISIYSLPNNDLGIVSNAGQSGNSTLGLFYSQIPTSQAQSDSFYAVTTYENLGRSPQPNTKVDFQFYKSGTLLANDTSAPVALLNYNVDTLGYTTLYPQGIGQYLVATSVSSDSVDFDPSNNVDTFRVAVTDTVFSISTSTAVSNEYYLVRSAYSLNSQYGTLFEVTNQDTVTSITTAMFGGTGATSPGAVIQGYIYPATLSSNSLTYGSSVVTTLPKTLVAGDLTTGATIKNITLPIDNSSGNPVLPTGLYFAAVGGTPAPGDSFILMPTTTYQTNGFPAAPGTTSGTLGYFSATDAPYCNMNLGHAATILYVEWTKNPASNPVKVGHSITFTAISNASTTPGSSVYTWTMTGLNSGVTYADTGKQIHQTFGVSDSFYVCVTVTSGGNSVEYCNWIVTAVATGINDITALDNVSLVPNPTTGKVTMTASDVNGPVSISVIDLLGETVNTFSESSNGNFSKTYDLSALSNGMYIVKIENAGTTVTKKLSINKQ